MSEIEIQNNLREKMNSKNSEVSIFNLEKLKNIEKLFKNLD